MTLGLLALLVALAVGIPLGIIAALRQNKIADYVSLFLATAGASVPNFVLAIVLVIIFAVKRMLPRSPLGRQMMTKLKVYPGAEHPHTAQQPKTLQVEA